MGEHPSSTSGQPDHGLAAGGEEQQLNVTQFVLEDGRVFRTKQAYESLIKACWQLGDVTLAERVFGENHAASVKSRGNNDWRPTLASLLKDIQNTCVEHEHGGL